MHITVYCCELHIVQCILHCIAYWSAMHITLYCILKCSAYYIGAQLKAGVTKEVTGRGDLDGNGNYWLRRSTDIKPAWGLGGHAIYAICMSQRMRSDQIHPVKRQWTPTNCIGTTKNTCWCRIPLSEEQIMLPDESKNMLELIMFSVLDWKPNVVFVSLKEFQLRRLQGIIGPR